MNGADVVAKHRQGQMPGPPSMMGLKEAAAAVKAKAADVASL
jgi:hypothetical protein